MSHLNNKTIRNSSSIFYFPLIPIKAAELCRKVKSNNRDWRTNEKMRLINIVLKCWTEYSVAFPSHDAKPSSVEYPSKKTVSIIIG